jgi:hypothetical protein
MALKGFLTKKIGPLPTWGWGAVAAGGTFLLLKGGGGGKSKKSAATQPSGGAGANQQPPNDAGNYTSTISDNQTFGGGSLGFLGNPLRGFGNVFVHVHRHPDGGGYYVGGRGYNHHAFGGHGFGDGGRHRGGHPGSDNRHGFGGGRDHREPGGNRGGYSGSGFPRGFSQGHYNPSQGMGSRIARSFSPNSSRYRDNNASSPGNSTNDAQQGAGNQGSRRG